VGQKVNPRGFRVGVYKDWDARWFARKSYGDQLLEDLKIRTFLAKRLRNGEVSRVEIEKAGDNIKIIIHSGRPGILIGKKGQEIDNLRREIAKIVKKNAIEISIQEIKNPELDATLVAASIAGQLERRGSYKKAMKRSAASTLRAGAKGIKICCAGRLNGAEIARTEWLRTGSVPLHTLRADIDYGFVEAKTTYGIIGVKVWIGRGEFQLA
jgi:small subunit ribosomal protein S3